MMVFRNGGILQTEDVWFYKCEQIEVVNNFSYLGLLLNFTWKFHVTQEQFVIIMYEGSVFIKNKML